MEREEAIQVVRGLTETTYFDDRELEGLRTLIPELTESEDERVRQSLLAYIKGESKRLDTKKWIAYIERQKEQKPAEWSEELAILEGYIISGDWSDAHKERALDILKSLRPSWKPSEEQMEAMEYVIRDYREDSCNATANYLQEILDHLKNM